jgi:Carboxypeptidase regulatory-like domain
MFKLQRIPWAMVVVLGMALVSILSFGSTVRAQSLVAGGISGVVTDPTAAVVADATVTLKSLDTGATHSATTSAEGSYRFDLLKPGRYEIAMEHAGFAKTVTDVDVAVGQTTIVNLKLEMASQTSEIVEVSGIAPLINTDPGASTSYTQKEVELLPTAGGDITTIAFTAPGVVVAQGSGYGNFTVNGLPGTSNLFTVNGENDMDPYFNINNSGASNLNLGSNEVQEVTVITNPYSGEYGQLSGAQISYVTKSGTNAFHGNGQWYWNGRDMNSNDFFANASGSPRPFSNANQWAASVGGPVIKNHTWFFVDTEGLRFILPNVDTETIPTPAFATAVLANVTANQPGEVAAYTNMFKIFSAAASGKTATPVALTTGDECSGINLSGFTTGSPCAETFTSTPTSFAKEWILAGRIDQKISSKDDLFFRFKIDHGLQPTTVDPLTPAFDANSNQPAYDYQAQLRHVFSSTQTNTFTATLSHYVAQFSQNVAAWQAAFPYGGLVFGYAGGFSNLNAQASAFPQGRNITQYQFVDDFSWVRGKHSLKFGLNFRRYDVSDHNFFDTFPLTIYGDLASTTLGGGNGLSGLQAFADGIGQLYIQQASKSTDVPIGIWGMGFYVADQWKITPRFSVMGALRFEKNANPVCNTSCFPNYKTSFPNLASISSSSPGDVPYTSDINTNLHSAYMSVDPINVSPRLSFSWSPLASEKTVISGGAGLFYDNPAAGAVDNLLGNPPAAVLFNIIPLDSSGAPSGILPFTQGPAAFAAAASAFDITKSFNQLSATLNPIIGFNPPISFTSIQGTVHSPQVQEWNLKIDQQLSRNSAISVNYTGNHSIHILYRDQWWNAAATNSIFASVPGILSAPFANYGTVTTLQDGAVANYNGLTVSLREQFHSWIFAHVNYTYSHALDEDSNGGLFPIGGGGGVSNIQTQINPVSLRANNYGNADYDIRHLFSADYVVTPVIHFGNRLVKNVLGGWQWSGKAFIRSGLPYTIIDGNASGGLTNAATSSSTQSQYGANVANIIAPGAGASCGSGAVFTNATPTPCANASAFSLTSANGFAYSQYPNETRNQFRGPHYIDFDMGLYKTFQFKERLHFGLGATAFNVFNHPNFNLPNNQLGNPQFGQITAMQGVPTSPYGNFLGFDSSIRVVQLSLKMSF